MKWKKLILLIALALFFALTIVNYAHQNKIQKEYLAKGIYEVGETFTYVLSSNSLLAYYMICVPPNDTDELVTVVLNFIQENDLTRTLSQRVPTVNADYIDLWFVEPSKSFPIGWTSGASKGSFTSDNLRNHLIISVHIPLDAQNPREYLIIARRNSEQEIINIT